MRDYFLSVFLNYFLFIVIGIIFHSFVADEFDKRIFILLLIGGIYYSPIYLISSSSLLFEKRISNPLLRIIILPLNISGLMIALLFIFFDLQETTLLFLLPAQLLTSSIIFGMRKLLSH